MPSKIYNRVGEAHPQKSLFNLSYNKLFNCDMGQLIPVFFEETVPGDHFVIGNEIVIRLQPLVAPILNQVDVTVHFFQIPNRILWPNEVVEEEDSGWEAFITGGVDGILEPTMPRWIPTDNTLYSLWDYFGFPVGVDPQGAYPVDFPRRAYNMTWNQYYRDETLQAEVDLDNESILNVCWEKDYFTSALLTQQRGIAPAFPVTGIINVDFTDVFTGNSGSPAGSVQIDAVNNVAQVGTAGASNAAAITSFNKATIDAAGLTTFNVADVRYSFQVQKWLERSARGGARYIEFLYAHFGVSPTDERLQRPEYIGGSKQPIIIQEVLQTSSTDATTPQGNLAGKGISVGQNVIGKCYVQEYGWILGLMFIRPKANYCQGINRQFLKETRYDYYSPEFANLSEQAIFQAEIFASDVDTENETLFGYQGRWDEMRIKHNQMNADMRDTFKYWHLGRIFNPASPPALNEEFVVCNPRKDIFAVQDEPGFIVNYGNLVKASRPIPIMSNPGLIDH